MASLGEMVQAAQATRAAKQGGDRTANVMMSILQGNMAGNAGRFDREAKMLDIQEKLTKIKESRQRQEVFGNLAKSMGILPMDPSEQDSARAVAHGALAPGARPPATQANKLMQFMNENEMTGMSFGQDGFKFAFGKKGGKGKAETPDDARQRRIAVMTLAHQAASDNIAATEGADPVTKKSRPPRPDEVRKFVPAFESMLSGDTKAYGDSMDGIRKAGDPLDALNGSPDMSGLEGMQ